MAAPVQEFTRIDEESASLEIEASVISSFKAVQKTRLGMRLFQDGLVHTASYLGQGSEEALLKQCQAAQGTGVPYTYTLPSGSRYERSFAQPALRGLETLHRHAAEALDYLRAHNDRFLYNGKANSTRNTAVMHNSQGVDLKVEYDNAVWWLGFKHRDSRDPFDGAFAGYSSERFDFMDSVRRTLPLLAAFEKRLPVAKGRRKVVFADPDPLLFKLSESLRIDRYREGACLYAGRQGQTLFNPRFSLFDVRLDPAHGVFRPFDGEGTLSPGDALPLIENGVFKNVISDLRYGQKYGAASTGNGQREPDANASLGFNQLGIGRGTRSTQELLRSLGDCILVTLSMGGDSTDQGELSLPVALAFQYQGGECVGRLEPFTLTGNLGDVLGSAFIEAASDGHELGALHPCVAVEMNVL
jgi:predicted Zn-dependent protease